MYSTQQTLSTRSMDLSLLNRPHHPHPQIHWTRSILHPLQIRWILLRSLTAPQARFCGYLFSAFLSESYLESQGLQAMTQVDLLEDLE